MLNAFWLNTLPTLYQRSVNGFAVAMLAAIALAFLGVSSFTCWFFIIPLLAVVAALDTFMDDKMQGIFWPKQKAVRPLATRLEGSRILVFLTLPLVLLLGQLQAAAMTNATALPLMLLVVCIVHVAVLLGVIPMLFFKSSVFRRHGV